MGCVFNTGVSLLSFLCFQLRSVLPGAPVVVGCHAVSREYRFAVCFCASLFLSDVFRSGLGLSAVGVVTVALQYLFFGIFLREGRVFPFLVVLICFVSVGLCLLSYL
jgi:hypothetical protein